MHSVLVIIREAFPFFFSLKHFSLLAPCCRYSHLPTCGWQQALSTSFQGGGPLRNRRLRKSRDDFGLCFLSVAKG